MKLADATIAALSLVLLGCAGSVKMTRLAPSALGEVGQSVEGVIVYEPMLVKVTHSFTTRVDKEGKVIGSAAESTCVQMKQKEEILMMADLESPLLISNASGPLSAAKFSVAINNGLLSAVNAEPTQKASDILTATSTLLKELAVLGAAEDPKAACNAGAMITGFQRRYKSPEGATR